MNIAQVVGAFTSLGAAAAAAGAFESPDNISQTIDAASTGAAFMGVVTLGVLTLARGWAECRYIVAANKKFKAQTDTVGVIVETAPEMPRTYDRAMKHLAAKCPYASLNVA